MTKVCGVTGASYGLNGSAARVYVLTGTYPTRTNTGNSATYQDLVHHRLTPDEYVALTRPTARVRKGLRRLLHL